MIEKVTVTARNFRVTHTHTHARNNETDKQCVCERDRERERMVNRRNKEMGKI